MYTCTYTYNIQMNAWDEKYFRFTFSLQILKYGLYQLSIPSLEIQIWVLEINLYT
jgi:hypothetical protein